MDRALYIRLLAAVAAVDGTIDPNERSWLGDSLLRAGMHPSSVQRLFDKAMARREQPLWFLKGRTVPEDMGREMLRDAMLMAFSDESYANAERGLLAKAARQLGLSDYVDQLPDFGPELQEHLHHLLHNQLLDIHNPHHRAVAAQQLTRGSCIAVQIAETYSLLSAATQDGVERLNTAKRRRIDRPASLLVSQETLAAICGQIDLARVHPDDRGILEQPQALLLLASALLVRLPIRADASINGQVLHPRISSQDSEGPWCQVVCPQDPSGLDFIRRGEACVGLLAATSMNDSLIREPTITSPLRALNFCKERGISFALLDRPISQGAFKIATFTGTGVVETRPGRGAPLEELLTIARQVIET